MATDNSKPTSKPGTDKRVFDVAKPGKAAPSSSSRPVIVGHKPEVQQDPMVAPTKTKVVIADGSGDAAPAAETDAALARHEKVIVPPTVTEASTENSAVKVIPEKTETDGPAEEEAAKSADAEPEASSKPADKSASKTEPSPVVAEEKPAEETPPAAEEPAKAETADDETTDDKTDEEKSDEANAVADSAQQAADKKKQIVEDKEQAARAEAIKKLVESKTYNVDIHEKHLKRGSSWLILLLVLLLALVIGYLLLDAGAVHINGFNVPVHIIGSK